jgi:hypothetical protein
MPFHHHALPPCSGGPKGACTQDAGCAAMGREQRCVVVFDSGTDSCRCWHDPRRFPDAEAVLKAEAAAINLDA